MKGQDQEGQEKELALDLQEAVREIQNKINGIETAYEKSKNLAIFKHGLKEVAFSLTSLRPFPRHQVLVQKGDGTWVIEEMGYQIIQNQKATYPEKFYLTPDGVLNKVDMERWSFTTEDYQQWEKLSPFAPGLPKKNYLVEADDQEYRELAPFIFKGLRLLAARAGEV